MEIDGFDKNLVWIVNDVTNESTSVTASSNWKRKPWGPIERISDPTQECPRVVYKLHGFISAIGWFFAAMRPGDAPLYEECKIVFPSHGSVVLTAATLDNCCHCSRSIAWFYLEQIIENDSCRSRKHRAFRIFVFVQRSKTVGESHSMEAKFLIRPEVWFEKNWWILQDSIFNRNVITRWG